MAAIFGVIATSPRIDLVAAADRMQARLAYRAPDGFGRWSAPGCVLGHGALHVGEVAQAAAQPMHLADGRICVADGYVANFDDVRARLGIDQREPLDDGRLLALAVERWDTAFTDHVRGEFVVATWDPRAGRLHIARDQLGGRPVCYVHTPDLFAFASHSLALAGLPGVPALLDPVGIAATWHDDAIYLDDTSTSFLGISALAPAHQLAWQPGGTVELRRYWRLQPQEPRCSASAGELVEEFQQVFGDAVARSMRGSAKTSLMLSGGVDSGAILAARRGFRAGGDCEDLFCISAVLDPRVDDAGAIAENANILAMTAGHRRKLQFPVPVREDRDGMVSSADLGEVAWSWMHPADNSLLVPSLVCRLARAHGSRLMLNGVDGDNMTSAGLHYVDSLVADGQLFHAWRESKLASRVNTYLKGQSAARIYARALAATLEPDVVRQFRQRRACERRIRNLGAHPVMAPGLASRAGLAARLREATERRLDRSPQQRCNHLAWWLGFSMAGSEGIVSRHGLEVRHPWCDLQVLEYFQRLPVGFRTRDGWTKWPVRMACAPAIGAEVAWHSGKGHLGGRLLRQVLEDAAPYLGGLLAGERESLQRYVRADVIREAERSLSAGMIAPAVDCDSLLTIVALAGWLRHVRFI